MLELLFPQTFDIPHRDKFSTVKPLIGRNLVHVAAGKTHSGVIDGKSLNWDVLESVTQKNTIIT